MTYNRPEVVLLGEATSVIRGKGQEMDEGPKSANPSYELDEE